MNQRLTCIASWARCHIHRWIHIYISYAPLPFHRECFRKTDNTKTNIHEMSSLNSKAVPLKLLIHLLMDHLAYFIQAMENLFLLQSQTLYGGLLFGSHPVSSTGSTCSLRDLSVASHRNALKLI